MRLPKLRRIGTMNMKKLLKYLCYCPESKHFMEKRSDLALKLKDLKEARNAVREMVIRACLNAENDAIPEAENSLME